MPFKITPEDTAKEVEVTTALHPKLLADFKAFCEMNSSSQKHVLREAVKQIVHENRKDIDIFKAHQAKQNKETGDADQAPEPEIVDLSKKEKNSGKRRTKAEDNGSIQVDTLQNPAGGAVLSGNFRA